jgi:HlyD family secretion protein
MSAETASSASGATARDTAAPERSPAAAARPRRRRHGALWAGAALLALAAAAGGGLWWRARHAQAVSYQTARLDHGAVARAVTASGTVNPVLTVIVGSYVSGVVQDIACDYNTPVRKGQVCATIDPRPYQMAADQAQAALGTARAQLVKDQAVLTYAEANYQRNAKLEREGWIAHDAAESLKSVREAAKAQVAVDQASIAQHQAALQAAQVNLGYTRITSPVDGIVVSRNVTQGQTVAASFQTPTLFLIAQDLTKMQVDTNVSESDIEGEGRGIRVGDPATFTVEAFPSRPFRGRVAQIRQAPQTVQNVVTYDVVIDVDNQDLKLKPGMTATVRIITDQRDQALRAPNAALRYTPGGLGLTGQASQAARSDQAGQSGQMANQMGQGAQAGPGARGERLYVLREGRPEAVPVRTGLADDAYTEIASGAVSAGDAVVTGETGGGGRHGAAAPVPRF